MPVADAPAVRRTSISSNRPCRPCSIGTNSRFARRPQTVEPHRHGNGNGMPSRNTERLSATPGRYPPESGDCRPRRRSRAPRFVVSVSTTHMQPLSQQNAIGWVIIGSLAHEFTKPSSMVELSTASCGVRNLASRPARLASCQSAYVPRWPMWLSSDRSILPRFSSVDLNLVNGFSLALGNHPTERAPGRLELAISHGCG